MELNREQIIKALEWAIDKEFCENCLCTAYGKSIVEFLKETLSLIKELTEENERLQKLNAVLIEDNHILSSECIQMAKADTVRKMQERLIYTLCINNEENTEFFDYEYTLETINQIAKEMLE